MPASKLACSGLVSGFLDRSPRASALARVVLRGAFCAGLTLAACGGDSTPPASGGSGGISGGSGGSVGAGGSGPTGAGGSSTPGSGGTTAANGGATGSGGSTAPGGGSGGTSGRPDAGGTGGAGMTPGGGDAGAPGACNIPCIASIDAECRATGACTEQAGLLGASNRCYTNGVKVINAISLGLMPSLTTTQRKADGSVCFTMTGTLQGQMANLTWKTAAGATIATGTYNTSTMKATVMCGGQSYEATPGDACASKLNLPTLPGMTAPPSGCTMGSCM